MKKISIWNEIAVRFLNSDHGTSDDGITFGNRSVENCYDSKVILRTFQGISWAKHTGFEITFGIQLKKISIWNKIPFNIRENSLGWINEVKILRIFGKYCKYSILYVKYSKFITNNSTWKKRQKSLNAFQKSPDFPLTAKTQFSRNWHFKNVRFDGKNVKLATLIAT